MLDNAALALIVNAPESVEKLLKDNIYDPKPGKKKGHYEYVQLFASSQKELENQLEKLVPLGKHDCIFWACYPKGTGTIKCDIKRDSVWAAFNKVGLDSVTAVSIDDTWSALRARPIEMIGKKKSS